MKWMFAAEKRGEVPHGTAERWAHHTPGLSRLPEHKRRHGRAKLMGGRRKRIES
jgi:hypothetical protein